jgi:hypothetical protein
MQSDTFTQASIKITGKACRNPREYSRRFPPPAAEEAVRLMRIDHFRCRDLRHTFASRPVMTVRHSQPAPRHLQEAVELLTANPTDTTTATERFDAPLRVSSKVP